MRNLITSMLGALFALVLFTLGGLVLFFFVLSAFAALQARKVSPSARLEPGSYLVFDLSTNITDAPPPFDFALPDEQDRTLQLRTVTRVLRAAARDRRIAGVLLIGSLRPAGYGSGYGALREVRAALMAFRASGKPVKAYLGDASTRDYYLASAADEIEIDPYGTIYLPGLASESTYLAGLFEKYGIGVQVTRVGRYKSYVEEFIRQDMSPADREQRQVLLDDVWNDLLAEIGRSRGLEPSRIQALVDTQGLIRPEDAKRGGLVDRIAQRDQLIDELKAETGPSRGTGSFRQVALPAYARLVRDPHQYAYGPGVAVVYAEGDIVEGEGQEGEVGGEAFAREIRRLREDGSVKAIVLRVNSPGGSVGAAEEIERELVLARRVKPVVVSFGTVAASGGYWISAEGDRVFAEPTTITGSIGVFGLQFDVQKLANDLGITFDRVKTGKFADALTITRPKTDEEMAILQRLVDWIYGRFLDKVAQGRHLKRDFVAEIAQGRVWSGARALRLGLADQVGGLDDAIRYAAARAGLGPRYRLIEYPPRKTLAQALAELLGRTIPEEVRARPASGLGGQIEREIDRELSALGEFNDPQGVYARLPLNLKID